LWHPQLSVPNFRMADHPSSGGTLLFAT
jgi:hypothetical protein